MQGSVSSENSQKQPASYSKLPTWQPILILVKRPKLIWVKDRISYDTFITALYLFSYLLLPYLQLTDQFILSFGKGSFRSVYVTYQQLSVPEPDQQTKHFHCRVTVINKINFILAFKRVSGATYKSYATMIFSQELVDKLNVLCAKKVRKHLCNRKKGKRMHKMYSCSVHPFFLRI